MRKAVLMDRYLLNFKEVKNMIEFIDKTMITEYEIIDVEYYENGVSYTTLIFIFTTYYTNKKEQFSIVGLQTFNANSLKENIKEILC